jgi:hypothetical protein
MIQMMQRHHLKRTVSGDQESADGYGAQGLPRVWRSTQAGSSSGA